MNTLVKNIESAIKYALEEYIKRITDKHDISSSDLESLWNDVSSDMKISISTRNLTTKNNSKSPTQEDTSSTTNVCSYLFSKGAKKGEICGSKTKIGTYCSRHKDHKDDSDKDDKKKVVKPKPAKKVSPVSTKSIVLRRNKDIGNKLWHPETQLVFKSTKDKTVIGKADGQKIIALSDDDIDNCKRMGFAFEIGAENSVTEDSTKKIPKTISEESDKKLLIKKSVKSKPMSEDESEEKSDKKSPTKKTKEQELDKKVTKITAVKSVEDFSAKSKSNISSVLSKIKSNPTRGPSDDSDSDFERGGVVDDEELEEELEDEDD